jgi:hypothetical protein
MLTTRTAGGGGGVYVTVQGCRASEPYYRALMFILRDGIHKQSYDTGRLSSLLIDKNLSVS